MNTRKAMTVPPPGLVTLLPRASRVMSGPMTRPPHRAPSLLLATAAVAAAALVGAASCKPKPHKTGGTGSTQQTGEQAAVVARVDDRPITAGDVQDRINKQTPFARARYGTLEKKKEILDGIIRIEVMAAEAERRGYDKDPDV